MNKPTNRVTSRVTALVIAITNIVSFSFGVVMAGRFVVNGVSTAARSTPAVASAVALGGGGLAGTQETPAATVTASMPIQGKGMWIWQFHKIGGGDPHRIVRAAVAQRLTHIYVRAGSSVAGLSGWKDIVRILPIAHRAGLKVIAWDFPYLHSPSKDVNRAKFVMNHTVKGHRVDGFAADVETRSEGTVLTRTRARNYATWLRGSLPGKFLVLVPPRPNSFTRSFYPYDLLVPKFDAVAPMVYWGSQRPDVATAQALSYLRKFGKPVAPIGQSFDMGPEGGPKGAPKGRALLRFMNEARHYGAVGVSFWSWQHTPQRLWHTIKTYRWPNGKKS
jgi:hypothetical protein